MARRARYFDRVQASRAGVYGFAGWIASFVFFAVVILWAFVPRDVLDNQLVVGRYLPDRYWFLAIPSFLVFLFLYVWAVFTSMNLMKVVSLADRRTVTDSHSIPRSAAVEEEFQAQQLREHGGHTAPIGDLPLDFVSDVLFPAAPGSSPR